MKKYYIMLFLIMLIVIGVTITVASPEFYENYSHENYQKGDTLKLADPVVYIDETKLQPSLASTIGQVFVIPQPDMPNHFITVDGPVPKQYLGYSVVHI